MDTFTLDSSTPHTAAAPGDKPTLRQELLAARDRFATSANATPAAAALARCVVEVVQSLEPERLGLYWPLRSEFNAVAALMDDSTCAKLPVALPFAQRSPAQMHFRAWNGRTPTARDECGILTSEGATVVPDVVLVPCVGFTPEGYRLGYGGGYFDRWLAQHPGVTAIGVAWSVCEMPPQRFAPQAHDLPLTLIVTEQGVVR